MTTDVAGSTYRAIKVVNLPRFDGHGNLREKERGSDVREKEEQGVQ